MQTHQAISEQYFAGGNLLPDDLSIWLPTDPLFAQAWQTVQRTQRSHGSNFVSAVPEEELCEALALLVCGLASGLTLSSEIFHACRRWLNQPPAWLNASAMRRCRHAHRDQVEAALVELSLQAWREYHCKTIPSLRKEDSGNPVCSANGVHPLIELQILCEVKERLNRSERADQLEFAHIEDRFPGRASSSPDDGPLSG
ncbi:MAG: hypothetical protein AB1813_27555 [Verrucomicrobiota bacterium]